jgi:hypothetical protein
LLWSEQFLTGCVQICRLYLYAGECQKALESFYVHVKRFSDFSRGWGIGEETFEYWSWMARQYRSFAELVELAAQNGVQIPSITLPAFPISAPTSTHASLEFFATPHSLLNPTSTIQHPAFYYYAAAVCSTQRRRRFEEASALEVSSFALCWVF